MILTWRPHLCLQTPSTFRVLVNTIVNVPTFIQLRRSSTERPHSACNQSLYSMARSESEVGIEVAALDVLNIARGKKKMSRQQLLRLTLASVLVSRCTFTGRCRWTRPGAFRRQR